MELFKDPFRDPFRGPLLTKSPDPPSALCPGTFIEIPSFSEQASFVALGLIGFLGL